MLKRLTNNWKLKLMSLVLALALWSHVRGEVNPLETATVKVRLRVDWPPDLVPNREVKPPPTVDVTLRGPRLMLRELKGGALANPLAPGDAVNAANGKVTAALDFSRLPQGRQEHLGEQNVPVKAEVSDDLRPDVEVIGSKPEVVVVSLDRAVTRQFAVQPRLVAEADSGLSLAQATVAPRRAEVSGMASDLARIASVQARLQPDALIGNLATGRALTVRVPVVAVGADGRLLRHVRIEPREVEVKAVLRAEMATQRVTVTALPQGTPATGFQAGVVTVTPSQITVRGPRRLLKTLADLRVSVDIEGTSEPVQRRVSVTLPEGVTAIDTAQVTVGVEITRAAETAAPEESPARATPSATEPGSALPEPAPR